MGGRHKIFEDPMPKTQDIRKTKYNPLGFFLNTLYYNKWDTFLYEINNFKINIIPF